MLKRGITFECILGVGPRDLVLQAFHFALGCNQLGERSQSFFENGRVFFKVRNLVEGAYNKARQLLSDNVEKLHVIAVALLEREVLDGDQLERLLRGEKLEPLSRRGSGDGPAAVPTNVEEEKPRPARSPAPLRPSESPGPA